MAQVSDPGRRPTRAWAVVPAPSSRLPGDDRVELSGDDPAVRAGTAGRAVVQVGGRNRRAIVGDDRPAAGLRPRTIEIVVEGWRFELEVEDAGRVALQRRATRERPAAGSSAPLEIRAMIPGRIVAVAIAQGDTVAEGQTLFVVEAMKMQNELRSPRSGTVERVGVGTGETIDLGDLLAVLA